MSFGTMEILIVLALVLIVFGAGKLPKVMGDLGKGVKSFKSAVSDEGDLSKEPAATKSEKSEK
jgi:sec-independent protein translocase protein TatA